MLAKRVRIALVVFQAVAGETGDNLGRMREWIAAARDRGADVVCFPEMNITGYGRNETVARAAEPIPGAIAREVAQMAKFFDITILAGLAEKGADDRLFASHLMASPRGRVEVYRKLHVAPPEQGFLTHGNRIALFNASGMCFGIQLCYDAHFPELSTHMAENGVDLVFMPHASPRGTPQEKYASWLRHLTARAFDNGMFVAACNQVGKNGIGLAFPGLALVIGPDGKVMADLLTDTEDMLVTDIQADALDAVRQHRMRYFRPHRRPELYK